MEREGSGYDKMYEVLLSQGKSVPEPMEGPDRFEVTVRRRILKPQIIDFMAKADQTFQLTQRERIALGLLAQYEALTARELVKALELSSVDALNSWINRLLSWGLVLSSGRTQATRYFVDPDVLRRLEFPASTPCAASSHIACKRWWSRTSAATPVQPLARSTNALGQRFPTNKSSGRWTFSLPQDRFYSTVTGAAGGTGLPDEDIGQNGRYLALKGDI